MRVRHVSEVSMLPGSAHDPDMVEAGTREPRGQGTHLRPSGSQRLSFRLSGE
jgi:hypothetical protein